MLLRVILILIASRKHQHLDTKLYSVLSLDTIHGPRTDSLFTRHVGDLGNITTDAKGTVTLNMNDWIIQLYNTTQSIINRTVIVHRHRDDGGQGGFIDSHTTGYNDVFFLK